MQHAPTVYPIFWGKNFATTKPGRETEAIIVKLLEGLASPTSAGLHAWQGILTQYFDSTGRVAPEAKFVTPFKDKSVPAPQEVNEGAMFAELNKAIETNKWPAHDSNAQFMILTAPGSSYQRGFLGESCAFHWAPGDQNFDFVPYQGENEPGLESNCVERGNPDRNPVHKTSKSASHEYAEAVTDAKQDTWLTPGFGEISDKCNFENDVELEGAWVQNLYDDHLNGCIHKDLQPPHVYGITESASSIGANTATVAATVNAEGEAGPSYHFEYGTTTSNTPFGSSRTNQQVFQTLSGLQPETTYHYRVVASNASGTTYGLYQSFNTIP